MQGKSLSLICSTLSWLFDDADRARKVAVEGAIETDRQTSGQKGEFAAACDYTYLKRDTAVPKWMIEQDIQRRINELEHAEQDLRDRLAEVRQNKLKRQQEAKDRAHYAKKRKVGMGLDVRNGPKILIIARCGLHQCESRRR